MKNLTLALLLLFSLQTIAQTENPKYDKNLAEKLGGDDYGMKTYVFVILKTGSVKIDDKAKVNELFTGHMANIDKLAKEDKLVIAGPFYKNENNYRGLFIFNVKTLEEAEKLLSTDPAVSAQLLEAEMYKWYGSAALGEYLEVHEKIEKLKP
ncbi:MAG: hypothetical protein BM557_04495 [Flavobacterium sp. MedPE-SWcel]|uniref:YciI family protein n=1 Tax=uncultured Flavobacterium sp. TaxID=165435 RepID=UPI0009149170|nr:YciI family protein [uncultured Flavobacterium sp.]OIQ21159.1 MAG: hypothetical protein BM557_04495 [Flavobacterium sp. MedPE-SWcel]